VNQRRVVIRRRVERELDALDASTQAAILAALVEFALFGRGDVRKLQGMKPSRYRLRVGDYRVIYELEPGAIIVLRVADRRDAYR
jgi:mRNA interferase RelE/StbE